MPSTAHAMQPANHSHAVLRIFLGCSMVTELASRKMAGQLDFFKGFLREGDLSSFRVMRVSARLPCS